MSGNLSVTNRTRQTTLVKQGKTASSAWARLIGLLGRRDFPAGDGLLLRGEQAIHTFGMQFPIDVVYVDRDAHVLRAIAALAPQRIGPYVRGACDILEIPVGTLVATGTRLGDELLFEFSG